MVSRCHLVQDIQAVKKWQILGLISRNARWRLWIKLWKFILRLKLCNRILCKNELIAPLHIKVPSPASHGKILCTIWESCDVLTLTLALYYIFWTKFTYYKQVLMFSCTCGANVAFSNIRLNLLYIKCWKNLEILRQYTTYWTKAHEFTLLSVNIICK